ncbi:MAG TPA: class I SAM-dependent methyltransferase [Anaerolineae bacterium]|nr:class I SAM-dependent methyltransferase [Anaerolineae bacterium]
MSEDKAIHLGHPSYVWGFGQERRLSLIRRHAPLEGRTILDVGCGLGMYVRAFRRYSQDVHGVDIDAEKVAEASRGLPNIRVAPAEHLPYASGTFDVVLLHEVIEHVADDGQAIAEAVRLLREPSPAAASPVSADGRPEGSGGRVVLFAPNRLYPFETHGAYWRGEYHFGNIPLVNYLPNRCRARFCPHVRAYTARDMRLLLKDLPVNVTVHTQIFPGYDKLIRRSRILGGLLRGVTYFLEHTPLRLFGLSHFVVAEKVGPGAGSAAGVG